MRLVLDQLSLRSLGYIGGVFYKYLEIFGLGQIYSFGLY